MQRSLSSWYGQRNATVCVVFALLGDKCFRNFVSLLMATVAAAVAATLNGGASVGCVCADSVRAI